MKANEFTRYEPHSCAGGAKTKKPVEKCLTSIENVSRGNKSLIMSLSFLPSNFFAREILITSCILKNKNEIRTTTLLDIKVTEYSFIDPSIVCRVYDKLQIKPIRLFKLKAI